MRSTVSPLVKTCLKSLHDPPLQLGLALIIQPALLDAPNYHRQMNGKAVHASRAFCRLVANS
jgi:hypothetical protein